MVILWILGIVFLLIVIQIAYSAFYFSRSVKLIKNSHVGDYEFGDKGKKEFKLYVTGDSVGAGVGASKIDTSVAGRLALHIAHDHFVKLKNDSVIGAKMKDLVKQDVPSGHWDMALLVISSNDLFRFSNLNEFRRSTSEVVKKYSTVADKVIIVGPGRVFDAPPIPIVLRPIYRSRAGEYAQIISEEVKKYDNVVHVNPIAAPKKLAEGKGWASPDKFHPGDKGHEYWFEMIKTAI